MLNFQKSAGMGSAFPKFSNQQKVLIFSADDEFVTEFRAAAPENPVQSMRLTPRTLSSVESLLQKETEPVAIYYATGTKTAFHLNDLPRALRSRIIVINGAYPGAIENPESYRKVIDLNSADPTSARWLVEKYFEVTPPEEMRIPAADNASGKDEEIPPPGG
jgi:hypothetical protein